LALPELDERHAELRLVWHPFWHPTARQIVRPIAQSVIHEIRVGVIAKAERKLTRHCCGLLLDYGFQVNLLTKSALVLRDLDLMAGRNARIGVTVTTLDERLRVLWELGCSTPEERFRVVEEARRAGLKTSITFAPLLPFLSDGQESLDSLFVRAADLEIQELGGRAQSTAQSLAVRGCASAGAFPGDA